MDNASNQGKIRSFTDINAWKEGHKLVLLIYKMTQQFPKSELFGLTDQMRRSAVSITSNIAEGFSRQSNKQKIEFYFMAKGSLTELQNLCLISYDVRYINKDIFDNIAHQTITTHKLINGLITSTKNYSKF